MSLHDIASRESDRVGYRSRSRAEHLPHVFESFYRIDQARTPGRGETSAGLGLAICRQIVESHGGTIEAESEQDEGKRFTVRLPLR